MKTRIEKKLIVQYLSRVVTTPKATSSSASRGYLFKI